MKRLGMPCQPDGNVVTPGGYDELHVLTASPFCSLLERMLDQYLPLWRVPTEFRSACRTPYLRRPRIEPPSQVCQMHLSLWV